MVIRKKSTEVWPFPKGWRGTNHHFTIKFLYTSIKTEFAIKPQNLYFHYRIRPKLASYVVFTVLYCSRLFKHNTVDWTFFFKRNRKMNTPPWQLLSGCEMLTLLHRGFPTISQNRCKVLYTLKRKQRLILSFTVFKNAIPRKWATTKKDFL